jgi:hypothetical protein
MPTPLSTAFLYPLHARPLLACTCGAVLEDVACIQLFCPGAGAHQPERVVNGCHVCGQGKPMLARKEVPDGQSPA